MNTEKDVTRYDEKDAGYKWVADGHLKGKYHFIAWESKVGSCNIQSESLSGVAVLTLYGIVSAGGNMVVGKVENKYMFTWYKDDRYPQLFASRDPKDATDKGKQMHLSEVSVNEMEVQEALKASIIVDLKRGLEKPIVEAWGKNPFGMIPDIKA